MTQNSAMQRGAQFVLGLLLFFIAMILTYIVIMSLEEVRGGNALQEKMAERVENTELTYINVKGFGLFPYQRLFDARSEVGESVEQFVVRISGQFRKFSDESGFEACGAIATDGEAYGVIAGSNQGHTACIIDPSVLPEGMRSTGETIHSHGSARMYQANTTDLLVLGRGGRLGKLYRRTDADEFSPEDFAHPGYLVGTTLVLHQNGRSSARKLAAVSNI